MHSLKTLNLFLQISNRHFSSQLPKLKFTLCNSKINNTFRFCSNITHTPSKPTDENEETPVFYPGENVDLSEYGSEIPTKFNFAMCADKSPIIQKYIDLGVNLFELEKRPEVAQFLVTLSPEKIQPYLVFFKNIGIPDDKLGNIITKNPFIFKEDLDDLQVRVNYLLSKKFDNEMIATIITKNSRWLSTPVKVIDEKLGYLQQTFNLKGDHIRKMVVQCPAIALASKKQISINTFALKEEMGLDKYSLKKLILSEPSILKRDPYEFVATYEYLIKFMKVPLDQILKEPHVLTCRIFILKDRHKFLEYLGRAQYCERLPGYVNLKKLVGTTDVEFCEEIARTPVNLFYEYLKTL